MGEIFYQHEQSPRDEVGYLIADARCADFVHTLHLFKYPEKYASYWRYIHHDMPVLYEWAGEWTDQLTDKEMLDVTTPLIEKASTLTGRMNSTFKFLRQKEYLATPLEWRAYIAHQADKDDVYCDERGNKQTASDILPNDADWVRLFTPQDRLSTMRLTNWLEKHAASEWPELPAKPETHLLLPSEEDIAIYSKVGEAALLDFLIQEKTSPE